MDTYITVLKTHPITDCDKWQWVSTNMLLAGWGWRPDRNMEDNSGSLCCVAFFDQRLLSAQLCPTLSFVLSDPRDETRSHTCTVCYIFVLLGSVLWAPYRTRSESISKVLLFSLQSSRDLYLNYETRVIWLSYTAYNHVSICLAVSPEVGWWIFDSTFCHSI